MKSRLALAILLLLSFTTYITATQKVLLYSRTAGFRHESIPNAIAALEKLGKQHNFTTVSTENPKHFEKPNWLNQFDALVFISVSGQALTSKGEVNMMKYIENGGGYFGIHEACDALYKAPWYGRLVGAYFDYHPYIQHFTLDVDHDHPSTSFLNDTWDVYDEVYSFNSDPRKVGKTVVLTVNPHSYKDPGGDTTKELAAAEGSKHPIAWYKEGSLLDQPSKHVGGGVDDKHSTPKNQRGKGGPGRSYYTALGHTKACWKDDVFLQHIQGALGWVLESPSIRSNKASLPSTAAGSNPPASLAAKTTSSTSNSTLSNSNSSNNSTNINKSPLIPQANTANNSFWPLSLMISLSFSSILVHLLLSV
jgi:type 1 glutamine amidotransferase